MEVLTKGHYYQLDSFEDTYSQTLQFIHKEPPENLVEGAFELTTVQDGTTNEEVLKVLIDRIYYLQDKFPCRENSIVITNLEESLMWLEKRTADRKNRGVEGKSIK